MQKNNVLNNSLYQKMHPRRWQSFAETCKIRAVAVFRWLLILISGGNILSYYCKGSRRRGISYKQQKEGRLTGLVTSCVGTAF